MVRAETHYPRPPSGAQSIGGAVPAQGKRAIGGQAVRARVAREAGRQRERANQAWRRAVRPAVGIRVDGDGHRQLRRGTDLQRCVAEHDEEEPPVNDRRAESRCYRVRGRGAV